MNETVRTDKRGVPYLHIRGGKYGWQYKHVALWEAEHGPLPAGHCVVFKDGNTLNCVLENLECITRAANLARNSGREKLTDKYVAGTLAMKAWKGNGGRGIDREIQQQALQMPELLGAKRAQLQLNRTLKSLSDDPR